MGVLVEKEATASTNDDARELALSGAPQGAAVLAAMQTRGRGRLGRTWVSPTGGLYLSVVLRPSLPPHRWSLLSLAMGAAAARVLRERGFPVGVKWPNDLLLGARKVGGILVESRLGSDAFAIVGFGLNLEAAPADAPEAASLREVAAPPSRRVLAEALRDACLAALARLEKEGPGPTLAEVRALCVTLGRRVVWEKGEGVALDIEENGALRVEHGGALHRVVAGDVRVRFAG